MIKPTFRNMKAGTRVNVDGMESIFLGFSDASQKYGESGVRFSDWKDLSSFYNIVTFKSLDLINEHMEKRNGYGFGIYAIFRFGVMGDDPDATDVYTAYRYKGRWCVGSGADAAALEVPSE